MPSNWPPVMAKMVAYLCGICSQEHPLITSRGITGGSTRDLTTVESHSHPPHVLPLGPRTDVQPPAPNALRILPLAGLPVCKTAAPFFSGDGFSFYLESSTRITRHCQTRIWRGDDFRIARITGSDPIRYGGAIRSALTRWLHKSLGLIHVSTLLSS